ncbi:MAG TPA: D-erythronate dehydrogenase [Burkholderiaceae bacterium]|nr:D-erythronate dehydrogenase [Burkholderiaceae bacterium]
MKVVVTGGAGFLGQRLIREVLQRGELTDSRGERRRVDQVVAVDQVGAPAQDRVRSLVGDVGDVAFVREAVLGADSVFHFAAVVSGAAEADFDLGLRVNLDGTRALLEALRGEGRRPKVVFSSSVAVFGGALPMVVDDKTTPTPQSSYGVQKLIGELLVGDYSRRGYVDGRAVRLPTIVVRPGKPNAAASSFASGIIREPLAGVAAVCPVDPDTEMWVQSPAAVITNLLHAHEFPAERWGPRSLSLPGITVSVRAMLEALAAVGGATARARVRMQPDPHIGAIVRTWPARFDTARADAMGFVRDGDFESVVRGYAKEYVL